MARQHAFAFMRHRVRYITWSLIMRMRLSIACVAGAVLVSEVTLTRLFSVTMIYHFAFLVLSMAMFGLAAGGIFNFLCEIFRKRATQALPALPLASALLLPLAIGASLHLPFSPSNFDAANVAALVLIILLCTVPFFTCGLFFSLAYLVLKKSVSQLYAYDLIGAGAACLIAIFLIERVFWSGSQLTLRCNTNLLVKNARNE